ncbi:MAG: hypothetical protein AAFP90_05940, partial [Planctomycetota bacterium]
MQNTATTDQIACDPIFSSPAPEGRREDHGDPCPHSKLMATSLFDVVSAWLMALLWFTGVAAVTFFVVWLSHRSSFPSRPIVFSHERPPGSTLNPEGFDRDFEPPGASEVEELNEPTLADAITAITQTVSVVAASLDSLNTNSAATTQGTAAGDNRPPGPGTDGE